MTDSTQPVLQEVSLLNPDLDNLTLDQINDLTELEIQEVYLDLKVEMDELTKQNYGTTKRARRKREFRKAKTLVLTAQDVQLMNLVEQYGALGNFEVARKMIVIQLKLRQPIAELVRRLQAEKVEKAKQWRAKSISRPNDEYMSLPVTMGQGDAIRPLNETSKSHYTGVS